MSLAPFLAAPAIVQAHALAAMGAFGIGLLQILGPKGTTAHRALGWAWVALMAAVATTSFWITEPNGPGAFSPIHLLSLGTLATLPLAVLYARLHRVRAHRYAMLALFLGGLVVAGGFTLLPGRLMGRVVFGT